MTKGSSETAKLVFRRPLYHYSGLTLNQYGVASPCPDLNLIHYISEAVDISFSKCFFTSKTEAIKCR